MGDRCAPPLVMREVVEERTPRRKSRVLRFRCTIVMRVLHAALVEARRRSGHSSRGRMARMVSASWTERCCQTRSPLRAMITNNTHWIGSSGSSGPEDDGRGPGRKCFPAASAAIVRSAAAQRKGALTKMAPRQDSIHAKAGSSDALRCAGLHDGVIWESVRVE